LFEVGGKYRCSHREPDGSVPAHGDAPRAFWPASTPLRHPLLVAIQPRMPTCPTCSSKCPSVSAVVRNLELPYDTTAIGKAPWLDTKAASSWAAAARPA